jgi:hypothetical protein
MGDQRAVKEDADIRPWRTAPTRATLRVQADRTVDGETWNACGARAAKEVDRSE